MWRGQRPSRGWFSNAKGQPRPTSDDETARECADRRRASASSVPREASRVHGDGAVLPSRGGRSRGSLAPASRPCPHSRAHTRARARHHVRRGDARGRVRGDDRGDGRGGARRRLVRRARRPPRGARPAADLAGVPLPAIAACVLVVATVLFWLIARLAFGSRRSRGGSGDAVLLCGVCGAGKTSLSRPCAPARPSCAPSRPWRPTTRASRWRKPAGPRGVRSPSTSASWTSPAPQAPRRVRRARPAREGDRVPRGRRRLTARRREPPSALRDPLGSRRRQAAVPVLVAATRAKRSPRTPWTSCARGWRRRWTRSDRSVKGQLADSAGGEAGAGNAARSGGRGSRFGSTTRRWQTRSPSPRAPSPKTTSRTSRRF